MSFGQVWFQHPGLCGQHGKVGCAILCHWSQEDCARGDQGGEDGWTTDPQSHPTYLQPCKVHFCVPYIGIQNGVLTTTGSILYGNRGTENSAFSITARLHGNLGTSATLSVWSTETEKAAGSMGGRKGPPDASLGSWVNQGLNQAVFSSGSAESFCCYSVAKSCPALFDSMDCSMPGSSVHGISQAKILEWIAISFSRGSS